jgi:hypothetical protein
MDGTADEHLSLVDIFHVVGTVKVHKYWSLVSFPLTSVNVCLFIYEVGTCCCES